MRKTDKRILQMIEVLETIKGGDDLDPLINEELWETIRRTLYVYICKLYKQNNFTRPGRVTAKTSWKSIKPFVENLLKPYGQLSRQQRLNAVCIVADRLIYHRCRFGDKRWTFNLLKMLFHVEGI